MLYLADSFIDPLTRCISRIYMKNI